MQLLRGMFIGFAALFAGGGTVQAEIFQGEEIGGSDEAAWEAEIEYGMVMTTGNTETESTNGSLEVEREQARWRQNTSARALRTVDSDTTVAERYTLSYKLDYRFRERDYGFATARYEDDRFSGYDYRASEALGYGRNVVDGPRLRFDLEVGAGMTHDVPEGGDREDHAMTRLAGDLRWQIREQARFRQSLLVEDAAVTYVESESSLTSQVVDNLAMRASLQVRHYSEVPAETEETDTITSFNLVYSM